MEMGSIYRVCQNKYSAASTATHRVPEIHVGVQYDRTCLMAGFSRPSRHNVEGKEER